MAESHRTHISDLPDELIFYIFLFLDEREQIIFGQVCQRWYFVTNYQSHWSRLLLHDVGMWNVSKITNRNELSEYFTLNSSGSQIKAAVWDPFVTSKTIFTMCSPKILAKKRRLKLLRENQLESSLISKVKTLLWKNSKQEIIPKWIMFGPGLETPGISIIAQKILKSRSNLFQLVEIINGGINAMKYECQLFHIAFLYSNTEALRQPLPAQERLNSSKLFTKISDGIWVPTNPAKMACLGSNCIIYVIDATLEIENIDDPFPDLTLIIQQTCLQYPNKESKEENALEYSLCLLVLACIPDENSPRPDWQQLLYGLNLWKYDIPWQVCLIIASNMANISIPFDWAMSYIKHSKTLQEKQSTEMYTIKI